MLHRPATLSIGRQQLRSSLPLEKCFTQWEPCPTAWGISPSPFLGHTSAGGIKDEGYKRLSPLPQAETNSVGQSVLPSFRWEQNETSLQLRPYAYLPSPHPVLLLLLTFSWMLSSRRWPPQGSPPQALLLWYGTSPKTLCDIVWHILFIIVNPMVP